MKNLRAALVLIALLLSVPVWAQTVTVFPPYFPSPFSTNSAGGVTLTQGNLILSSGQLLMPDGTAAAPSSSFSTQPTTGTYYLSNAIGFSTAGTRRGYVSVNGWYLERDLLALGASSNLNLYVAAADTLALRRGVNAQTLIVNGTWTDAANYVRASLAATATTVTLAAQTAGTGADNIDVALTPAGTGNVTTAGGITSSNTGALGWSIVAAANQACTTTCTSAAVMGFDTASGTVPVGPTDAAADICLCAGAN